MTLSDVWINITDSCIHIGYIYIYIYARSNHIKTIISQMLFISMKVKDKVSKFKEKVFV